VQFLFMIFLNHVSGMRAKQLLFYLFAAVSSAFATTSTF